jgi:YbgC/YbaW family acyl-CoA thioester hydrolase
VLKKVHWSDCDAAGIAWFANYFRWFEDAEEELFTAVLGQPRQALLDALAFGMPRVEAHANYHAPITAGQVIRIGITSRLDNPRRLRHEFEMRDGETRLLASGVVRVACFDLATRQPRDLPGEVVAMVDGLPAAAAAQGDALPWV